MIPYINLLAVLLVIWNLLTPSLPFSLQPPVNENKFPVDVPMEQKSRWAQRTAKRRLKTESILSTIDVPSPIFQEKVLNTLQIPILDAPVFDWDTIDSSFDPQKGGKLKANSLRAIRKRAAIEAFTCIAKALLHSSKNNDTEFNEETITIVDAGSGAGNLAIPLAGLLHQYSNLAMPLNMLAIDVNPLALDRLSKRWDSYIKDFFNSTNVAGQTEAKVTVTTLCADLAQQSILPKETGAIFSLHACGAATDMAIRLATSNNIPFVISPCCIGKITTQRVSPRARVHVRGIYDNDDSNDINSKISEAASFQRSGAPKDITYPRSDWLLENLSSSTSELDELKEIKGKFSLLAKIADMGLGPQSSIEQVEHQRVAKMIIEMDRLMCVAENNSYEVRLMKLKNHDGYGKTELLLGAPIDSKAANVIRNLPVVV